MEAGLPDVSSEDAEFGTLAHEVAASALRAALREGSLGAYHVPNALPREIADAVRFYVEFVWDAYNAERSRDPGARLLIEERVTALTDPGDPVWGTADAIVVSRFALRVIDLKTGIVVVVEAEGNEQLLTYLLGAVNEFDVPGWPAERWLAVTVVQPRAPHALGPVRSALVTHAKLREFASEAATAARATRDPDAPLTPGEWCQYCKAAGHCPALAKQSLALARQEFADVPAPVVPDVRLVPIERLGAMMLAAPQVEAFLRAARKRIEDALLAGETVPGWKLVPTRPRRIWKDPDGLVRWSQAGQVQVMKVKSVSEVEAEVGRGNIPEELVVRVSSGESAVPESDPRPAVENARDAFREPVTPETSDGNV